jgi:hypothetical protein
MASTLHIVVQSGKETTSTDVNYVDARSLASALFALKYHDDDIVLLDNGQTMKFHDFRAEVVSNSTTKANLCAVGCKVVSAINNPGAANNVGNIVCTQFCEQIPNLAGVGPTDGTKTYLAVGLFMALISLLIYYSKEIAKFI